VSKYLPDEHRIFAAGDDARERRNTGDAGMRKSGHFDGSATGAACLMPGKKRKLRGNSTNFDLLS